MADLGAATQEDGCTRQKRIDWLGIGNSLYWTRFSQLSLTALSGSGVPKVIFRLILGLILSKCHPDRSPQALAVIHRLVFGHQFDKVGIESAIPGVLFFNDLRVSFWQQLRRMSYLNSDLEIFRRELLV
jgi:hypothetical protein